MAEKPQAGSTSSSRSSRSASARSSVRREGVSPEQSQQQKWELARHESARKRRGGGKGQVGQLNLTSMIDVIFLLLIYFVITANFVENEGVLVAKLPAGTGTVAPPDELPPQNIDIHLTSYDTTGVLIQVGGAAEFHSFAELTAYLISIQNDPAKGRNGWADVTSPVTIKPAGGVRWNHVVNAFNSSFSAGYSSIAFAQASGG